MIYGLLGLFLCIGPPVIGGIYFARYRNGTFLTFLTGMLSFAVTQLVLRIPLLNLLGSKWDWFSLLPVTSPIAYTAVLAFSAGIFEETGRLVGLKYFRKGQTSWINGLAFGLGHGGIEAIWVASLGLLPALRAGTLSMAGMQGVYVGLERLCAMLFHIAMTLIVLAGIRRKRLWGWICAILIHGAYNFSIVLQNQSIIWGVLISGALLSLAYLLWTKKHWKSKKENVL